MNTPRFAATLVLLPALLLAAKTDRAHGQVARGEVVDAEAGRALQGALVLLLDEHGAQAAGGLTDEHGRFVLRAPAPGRYVLRIQRIGHADGEAGPFELAAGETITRTFALASRALALGAIEVQGDRRCTIRPRDGRVLAQLWDEVRKALDAAAFTDAERIFGYRVRHYRRVLDATNLRVVADSASGRTSFGEASPYAALPADSLIRHGFIQQRAQGADYYAPDAHALLSDAFLDAYCFRLAGRDARGLVGIGFEPVEDRGPPAVAGTLWVDAATHELRHLEFRYVRTVSPLDAEAGVGGRVEFEAMPNGSWIVRRWWIRMPSVAQEGRESLTRLSNRTMLRAFVEEGGEVLEVRARRTQTRLASSGTVEGIVHDSARAAPLDGALVFLSGTTLRATTDASGRFRIEDVPDGTYALAFSHPDLVRWNVHPTPVTVHVSGGDRVEVELGVAMTARAAAMARACGAGGGGRNSGVLAGSVLDEIAGTPVADARVTIAWRRLLTADNVLSTTDESVVVRPRPDGGFVACGLPLDRGLLVRVQLPGDADREVARLDELGRARFAELELRVPPRAVTLDAIEATARSAVAEARRASGTRLSVLTRADITPHAASARNAGDLTRRLPGVRVREVYFPRSSTLKEICVESVRGPASITGMASEDCPDRVLIVVDGVPMTDGSILLSLSPAQLESMQFVNAAEGATRWGTAAARGVLLIHTRGNGPFAQREPE